MEGRAKVRYITQCNTHGIESKDWAGRMVVVPKPLNKRQRLAGCPLCAAEARKEERAHGTGTGTGTA